MSKHHFEIIEEGERSMKPQERQSSQEDASQERIGLPSGNWILRSRFLEDQRDSLQFEEGRGEEEPKKIIFKLIAKRPQKSEEKPLLQYQQQNDRDDQSSSQPPATHKCQQMRSPEMLDTNRKHVNYINCTHCANFFHIRCDVFTERRTINESYICTQCERSLRKFSA